MSWEILDENVMNKIKLQKSFEDETAKKLTPLYETAENPIIKLYIHRIILDTQKHSDTYQILINLNDRAMIGKESQMIGEAEIKSHVAEEAKMLKQTQEIIQSIKDSKAKQLVEGILEDEKRHHRDLQRLLDLLKKEAKEWDVYFYDLITGFP
jgi:DNA topoisomerase IB